MFFYLLRFHNVEKIFLLFKPSAYTLDYHISRQSRTDSLLFNWSATGKSEGSGNETGLKSESRTRSRIRTPVSSGLKIPNFTFNTGHTSQFKFAPF